MHTEEYDEDYEDERATEYKAILDEEDTLLHHSSWKRNAPSIDIPGSPSIDTQPPQRNRKCASTDIANYSSIDAEVNRVREGDYSIGSWADDHHHESFAVETSLYEPGVDELHEAGGIDKSFKLRSRHPTRPSIDVDVPTSVDRQPKFCRRAFDSHGTRIFYWEDKDEYEIYRDDQGCARDMDGHIINVSKEEIRKLMERALRDEPGYICLPAHANLFTQTKLVPEIYTKNEINEMFYGVCGEQEKNKEAFQLKLDGFYYPLNDSISWLTTCMEEMKQDIARIQHATDVARSEEIDLLVEEINRALETTEERLDGRCDDIYFPMDLSISALTSKIEAMQGELIRSDLEISDDFGVFWRYLEPAPEMTIELDHRSILEE
ncbi:hypothetical protein DY000_02006833 [Brassica cretica]|uniref:DUF287 domain-containing protein n=1 Tax=Brassica cretica TaxID=69181 RepID=A0ABQ7BY70_BRACR|nr:hypothetical protein DY000_02006833 [Brassica cretica]